MTLKECYTEMGGSYEEVIGRLAMDQIIEKLLLKFLEDGSIGLLRKAIDEDDIENAFRASHTLKGVAANLGFTNLMSAADELTEQLRDRNNKPNHELFNNIEKQYKVVIDVINRYFAEK